MQKLKQWQRNNFNSVLPGEEILFITNNTESNVSTVLALNAEQNETAGSDKLGGIKNVQSVQSAVYTNTDIIRG